MLGRQSDPLWPFVLPLWGLALTISPNSQCQRMERRRPMFLRLQYLSRVWGASILTTQTYTSWRGTGCKKKEKMKKGRDRARGKAGERGLGGGWIIEEILETGDGGKIGGRREGEKEWEPEKIPEQQSAWRIKASLKIRLAQMCLWSCCRVHSKLWRVCQLTTTDMYRCLRY